MDKKISHMLHQLKGKTFPPELDIKFCQHSKEVIPSLKSMVKDGSEVEKSNAIKVLFSVYSRTLHKSIEDYVDLVSDCLLDDSILVRSSAAAMVSGALYLNDKSPDIYPVSLDKKKSVIGMLEKSYSLGLYSKEDLLIQDCIKKEKPKFKNSGHS